MFGLELSLLINNNKVINRDSLATPSYLDVNNIGNKSIIQNSTSANLRQYEKRCV